MKFLPFPLPRPRDFPNEYRMLNELRHFSLESVLVWLWGHDGEARRRMSEEVYFCPSIDIRSGAAEAAAGARK